MWVFFLIEFNGGGPIALNLKLKKSKPIIKHPTLNRQQTENLFRKLKPRRSRHTITAIHRMR